jgi:hypothetical protein
MSDEEDLIQSLTEAATPSPEERETPAEDKPADDEPVGEVHDPYQGPGPHARILMQEQMENILFDYSQLAICLDRDLARCEPGSMRTMLAKQGMLAARKAAASIAVGRLTDILAKDMTPQQEQQTGEDE